jgi:hypothetical protein
VTRAHDSDGRETLSGNGARPLAPGQLPVLARDAPPVPDVRELPASPERRSPGLVVPAVQAAAAAAGGFLAGAALIGLLQRRRRRTVAALKPRRVQRRARGGARGRRPARVEELVQIVGTRSLLVDVHLLGER